MSPGLDIMLPQRLFATDEPAHHPGPILHPRVLAMGTLLCDDGQGLVQVLKGLRAKRRIPHFQSWAPPCGTKEDGQGLGPATASNIMGNAAS